jgi:predicted nucleic acid-binding protein
MLDVQLYKWNSLAVDIVIDTSAVLAVLAGQREKSGLVAATRGAALAAPPSLHWEVGNALSAMFKRRAIRLEQARSMLDAYAGIPIRREDVSLTQAAELCAQLGMYAYDAYVICCAMNLRSPLLTLDAGLAARARECGVRLVEIPS